ncbi:MAG: phospholipase C, phosphocholine-specific [Bacteroidota bacterium]|nr:phospholipase C, phosphocholine-specific [Bacteroidota bacterium]
MDTRREFMKKAALLAGGQGFIGTLPPAVLKALSIDPAAGSTWLDAEHIVILMQENRSFDHCYGALRGIRGFRDPRAITLPNGNPVWLQTNEQGETYAPFRLDIKGTNATWMGSLPHDWTNQTDARNDGRYDQWLQAKHSDHKEYAHMPLTLGHYVREDVPFYYALADAFTICDQAFCSSLTGTTPNRLHLWAGTIRDEQRPEARPRVRNGDTDYGVWASFTSFPERLEDHGVSWKIYQNEIGLDIVMDEEANAWLSNFQDNPIEWFTPYHVRFSRFYRDALPAKIAALTAGIEKMKAAPDSGTPENQQKIAAAEKALQGFKEDKETFTQENFDKLPQREKNLHNKAFDTNHGDPHYHELSTLSYQDGDKTREMKAPKGDILHSFRQDVRSGKLPAVSWLVPPERFSDHPSSAWYGPWYISEALDILTENPEVWKKTIFILCYDENDGYFDHVPPFVAPHPDKPGTGLASKGIDTALEHMTREQDLQKVPESHARGGPIGLGFRVPLVVASPWSRGGYVNSQVFDHTSILMLLEKFLSHKLGKKIEETNINSWRRTVCGDMSSVFRPFKGENTRVPFPGKGSFLESIHRARFKQPPAGFVPLSVERIEAIRKDPSSASWMEFQERGIRPACALPYELNANGRFGDDGKTFVLSFEARNSLFGPRAAGSPFTVYAYGKEFRTRNYAVAAGDRLEDRWTPEEFGDGKGELRVCGPNGLLRVYTMNGQPAPIGVTCDYEGASSGRLQLKVDVLQVAEPITVIVRDNAYKHPTHKLMLPKPAGAAQVAGPPVLIDTTSSGGWYDVSVHVEGLEGWAWRFAGHIETGHESTSDPAMG